MDGAKQTAGENEEGTKGGTKEERKKGRNKGRKGRREECWLAMGEIQSLPPLEHRASMTRRRIGRPAQD